jgi:hypothetical protein
MPYPRLDRKETWYLILGFMALAGLWQFVQYLWKICTG